MAEGEMSRPPGGARRSLVALVAARSRGDRFSNCSPARGGRTATMRASGVRP